MRGGDNRTAHGPRRRRAGLAGSVFFFSVGAYAGKLVHALLYKFQSTATAVHLSMLGMEVAAKIVLVGLKIVAFDGSKHKQHAIAGVKLPFVTCGCACLPWELWREKVRRIRDYMLFTMHARAAHAGPTAAGLAMARYAGLSSSAAEPWGRVASTRVWPCRLSLRGRL